MRINEKPYSDRHWIKLLDVSFERGVRSLHSSSEYKSFPRLCELLHSRKNGKFSHIVKLAEPHFGENCFDTARLNEKIDYYLKELNTERIECVQWMWRGDIKNESSRINGLKEQNAEISSAFAQLKNKGKVSSFSPFPYTNQFAEKMLECEFVDGITAYLNPIEREMEGYFERADQLGKIGVAIRPFAAGKALGGERSAADCVKWVQERSGTSSIVLSYSVEKQIASIV